MKEFKYNVPQINAEYDLCGLSWEFVWLKWDSILNFMSPENNGSREKRQNTFLPPIFRVIILTLMYLCPFLTMLLSIE